MTALPERVHYALVSVPDGAHPDKIAADLEEQPDDVWAALRELKARGLVECYGNRGTWHAVTRRYAR